MRRSRTYVRISGGLGNQLFQYAFGRAVSDRLNSDLVLEKKTGYENDIFNRRFKLDKLFDNITYVEDNELSSFLIDTNILSRIIRKLLLKIGANRTKYYRERQKFVFDEKIMSLPAGILYEGYWQNVQYFDSIKYGLIQSMILRDEKLLQMLTYVGIDDNAVALHLRYPHAYIDGIKHKGTDDFYITISEEYYAACIKDMLCKVPKAKFVVFSDNSEWAEKFIKSYKEDMNYVLVKNNDEIMDFKLMCSCKHFIISNSTYSWWAAYIGESDTSEIMAPLNWFKHVPLHAYGLFPNNWTLIQN